MEIVDAHVHCWSLSTGLYPQFENPPRDGMLGDAGALRCDHRLADLRTEAADFSLRGAVAIEANPRDPVAGTSWLAKEADTDGLPLAVVVSVNLERPDAREQIEAHVAASDRVKGVRQVLNVHSNPAYDYVGQHLMRKPRWRSQFALLGEYGLSFDLQLYPHQMSDAVELARAYPETMLVLNHVGMWADRSIEGWRTWRDELRAFAECPNSVVKLSGLAMLDQNWTVDSFRPLVFEALDAFGIHRCIFASNFPIDGLFSHYTRLYRAWQRLVSSVSDAERHALFVDNARRIYRLAC